MKVANPEWPDLILSAPRGAVAKIVRPFLDSMTPGSEIGFVLPDECSRLVYRRIAGLAHGMFGAGGYRVDKHPGKRFVTVKRLVLSLPMPPRRGDLQARGDQP